jgi:hypothetical protein
MSARISVGVVLMKAVKVVMVILLGVIGAYF